MKFLGSVALAVAATLFFGVAFAVTPDEMLKDPVLEGRARAIGQLLRCVVCQNQSIDDSSAPLAKDLRVLLRERLEAGDSDSKVIDYVVARYGHFVLLKPPLKLLTLLLWFGPFLLFGFAVWTLVSRARKRVALAEHSLPLDVEEERNLARLMRDEERT